MSKLMVLLKRDLKKGINARFFILEGFMALLQIWFILGSGSVGEVSRSGRMHFMAVVFSFNLFGSITALAMNHDIVSTERESKIMDMILTSGVSKVKVIICKIACCFLLSSVFALIYILIIGIVYFMACGSFMTGLTAFGYLVPVISFMFIYGLMGFMFSILFRSSKQSLIISVILGGLFIPRLFVSIFEGIGKAAGMGTRMIENLTMLSPALIMNYLTGYDGREKAVLAITILAFYILVMTAVSVRAFITQDELNYGEGN